MLITKRTYKKEIRYWRRWYLRFHRELFCKNVFEKCGKAISIDSSSGRKNCSKNISMKAIDVGKTVLIDAGKKLVEKAVKRLSLQNHKWLILWFHQKKLLKK